MGNSGTIQDDIKSIKEGGLGLVRHAKDDAAQMAENMLNEGGHRMEDVKSFSTKYMKLVESEITNKPIKSMAIAIGVGAVLSFLLRRG